MSSPSAWKAKLVPVLPDGHRGAVLVLSAISGVFSAFAVMCFIPFTMGLFMVLSDGVLHRSLLWWKRGAMQFANGFANGFMFALVSVWFASCSQRAMLSPYGMQ